MPMLGVHKAMQLLGIHRMSDLKPEFYRYCRSKGAAFGHSARSRNAVKAWGQTKAFLDKFTDYELTLPTDIELKSIDGIFNEEVFNRLEKQFGEPFFSSSYSYKWRVESAFNDDLISIALDNSKYEGVTGSLVSMSLYFNFYWKTFSKSLIDDNSDAFGHFFRKGHHGKFSVSISDRVFIQPEFVVPIESNEKLSAFVDQIVEDLPFKFQNKSFISFYSMMLKNGKTKYKAIGYYNENS